MNRSMTIFYIRAVHPDGTVQTDGCRDMCFSRDVAERKLREYTEESEKSWAEIPGGNPGWSYVIDEVANPLVRP